MKYEINFRIIWWNLPFPFFFLIPKSFLLRLLFWDLPYPWKPLAFFSWSPYHFELQLDQYHYHFQILSFFASSVEGSTWESMWCISWRGSAPVWYLGEGLQTFGLLLGILLFMTDCRPLYYLYYYLNIILVGLRHIGNKSSPKVISVM